MAVSEFLQDAPFVRMELPLAFQLWNGFGVGTNPREDEVTLVGC